MGKKRKKRKKSKSRKKRRQRKSRSSDSSVEVEDVEEVGDEGDSGDEDVAAVIDVDDDLEEPEARAELIAAVAELSEAEPAATGDGEPCESEAGADADEEAPGQDPDEEGAESELDEEAAEAEADEEGTEAKPEVDEEEADAEGTEPGGEGEAETPEDQPPLIGPDALVALSQFREEGVATVPEELVLDLGETTSPEERDRLLAAALAHVEMQEAIYRVPTESGAARRWKGLIAAALFVFALFVAGVPPDFLVPEGPPALTSGERLRGLRSGLLLQAEQIEAFEVREGRLPDSLSEVETTVPGIRYVRSSGRLYQLVAYTVDGDAVVYDSAAPDPAFAAISGPWSARMDDS